MSNSTPNQPDVIKITPPFAGLTGLSILAWIVFGIFNSLDDERYYFTISMFLAGLLAAYQLRHSRKSKNPIEGGTVAFFVMVWLAVFTFTSGGSNLEVTDFTLTLRKLELIALLPLSIVWVLPFNEEKFFGIMELEQKDKLHAVWRSSVLVLIIVNLVELGDEWYWKSLEFAILIPMIVETTQLQKSKKEQLPVLTLFIQTEMTEKFEVPFSLFKSVFLIMICFLFGILISRIWLLVILIYFGAGVIWAIGSLIPEEMRSDDDSKEDFGDKMREMFGAEEKSRRKRRRRQRRSEKLQIEKDSPIAPIPDFPQPKKEFTSTALTTSESSTTKLSTELSSGTIQEKAHAMGQRVRTGIAKPYYTLNHILSTLKEEDFSQAWRVDRDDLTFPSKRGKWSPPIGLILFPVEFDKYDYRRAGEILLLGFNRPFEKKDGGAKFEFGGSSKSKTRITDNSIRFDDVEFNTRSLIVTEDQWSEIKSKLQLVTQDDDISYTGFKTLKQMQETLVKLSDKWLEVRFTAQEAAVNFLAGLLGSSAPIFVPREGLPTPTYPEIEGKIIDVTEESEEK
ncbi:MAG: hypothetical protein ACW99Q_02820 [Candidatus Kariarchaeaceae archaeon]|jgi:hypothetical protein